MLLCLNGSNTFLSLSQHLCSSTTSHGELSYLTVAIVTDLQNLNAQLTEQPHTVASLHRHLLLWLERGNARHWVFTGTTCFGEKCTETHTQTKQTKGRKKKKQPMHPPVQIAEQDIQRRGESRKRKRKRENQRGGKRKREQVVTVLQSMLDWTETLEEIEVLMDRSNPSRRNALVELQSNTGSSISESCPFFK